MDLNKISLFSSLSKKMEWLNERQKVLAQNIANANTPGYIPKDLKNVSFKAHVDRYSTSGTLQMQVDEKEHMKPNGGAGASFEIKKVEARYMSTSPDGNAVNLEDELMKMTETQMDYTMAVNLYRKHVGLLKTALGKKS
ncbi:flagellar basal body rod protein FlgB [Luteithermobacter gelatinilyticus]|uniref:flagellar basal body rod protein FlgB n=1 Tax=Luteithermobacter gelatinilyticus TaxID=2582913 RepID=UPI001106322D|nr:flagellar basal body rod protein FlgB [Luteithermobacter gelatinilyticus]|tara:strand:- start:3880 stop:4296 length:417 start_codon:yes stop_codon:yes gene_type:complete